MLNDRPQRQGREERERSNDDDHADQQRHVERPVGGKGSERRGNDFLPDERTGDGEGRDDHQKAAELGYAPLLEQDAASRPIEPGRRYAYEPDRGPVAANGAAQSEWTVSGRTLLDLAHDDYSQPESCDEARRLMRALISHRLGGQALHTRAVLMELQEL